MFKRMAVWALVVSFLPLAAYGQTQIVSEDFESGLGAWTVMKDPLPPGDPGLLFNSGGFAPDGTELYGPRTPYSGQTVSQCAGFSVYPVDWDGDEASWLQQQWTDLDARTYNVTIEMDLYVYYGDTDPNGVGNRIYLLTDDQFNDPAWDYHSDPSPGFGQDYWPGVDDTTSCQDVGGGVYQCVGPSPANGQSCINEDGDPDDGMCSWGYNGVWRQVTISRNVTTASGNMELRLLMQKKHNWPSAAAWDNVHVTITPVDENGQPVGDPVVDSTEDFESSLGAFTVATYPPPRNDTPRTFSPTDPLLYPNLDNPGSTSAGYSSNMDGYDGTYAEWIQQQFPNAVPADEVNGTEYDVKLEFDRYVYWEYLDNDTPFVFPADGAGMYGSKANSNGTKSAGFSSDLTQFDDTNGEWLRQLFPAAVPADPDVGTTYSVTLDLDVYVYKDPQLDENGDPSQDPWGVGNRLLVLTDDQYDNADYYFEDPAAPGFRVSYWPGDSDWANNGVWQHKTITQDVTTKTGNFELRLLCHDKSGGAQTVAWDNVVLTVGSTTLVSEDFESGLGNWTVMANGEPAGASQDAYGVGNRVYVLTNSLYNNPAMGIDWAGSTPDGFAVAYWPGDSDWNLNGVWQHEVVEQRITTTTGNIELRLLQHDKHERPQVVAWDNVSLTLTYVPPRCGEVRFDADGDGDVDQADFAVFQSCYTGDGVAITDIAVCGCMDSDYDSGTGLSDVDAIDLQAFEACASGPGIPAVQTCDDLLPPPPPLP